LRFVIIDSYGWWRSHFRKGRGIQYVRFAGRLQRIVIKPMT